MGYFAEQDYENQWEQENFCMDEPSSEDSVPAEPDVPATPAPQAPPSTPSEPAGPAPALPGPSPGADDDAARQAHEAAEAQRKAEWEAAQAKKRAEEQEQLDRIANMNEDALRLASVRRISLATDKMTNRSMKDAVSAHLQSLCDKDLDFARLTMHPRKSMLHCIQYIFRQAQDYIQKELGADTIKPNSVYGGDIPDGLCLQWAEDYFRDPDAKEDQKPGNEFIPRPYIKPYKPKPAEPKPAPKPKGFVDGQISLLGEAS